jgi:ribosome-associated translation inhibitor RaiA
LGVSAQLYIERRLRSSLERIAPRIRRVTVLITDRHRCRIEVRILPTGTVLVEEKAEDLYEAIGRAVDRAALQADRSIRRARDIEGDAPSLRPRHASTLLDPDE